MWEIYDHCVFLAKELKTGDIVLINNPLLCVFPLTIMVIEMYTHTCVCVCEFRHTCVHDEDIVDFWT